MNWFGVAAIKSSKHRENFVKVRRDVERLLEVQRSFPDVCTVEIVGARIAERVSDFFTNGAPIRFAGHGVF